MLFDGVTIGARADFAKKLVRRALNEGEKRQNLAWAGQRCAHATHCPERVVVWLYDERIAPSAAAWESVIARTRLK